MTNVGTLINFGATVASENSWASNYVSDRVLTLINKGYNSTTAQQIAYFELGVKISLDQIATGFTTSVGVGLGAGLCMFMEAKKSSYTCISG